ncbi:isochorismatase family cysteine hydrolase [Variovorax humicola]|jgi:nicotinamidase-related amidase|uniref:Isochorismatase family cysteine hydrolase n=1 Tax=Variovorax humicola TaxID=1769758 RepID=A0ABU8VVA5_9BURK
MAAQSQDLSQGVSQGVAVLALHYQNDVLHPEGKIRVGMSADSPVRGAVIAAAQALLQGARQREWPIVHVRIAFRPDYADLIQNAPIFRNVAAIGAVMDGAWGSAFYEPLGPDTARANEFVVRHRRVNAFYGTELEELLRIVNARRLVVAGVATHSVVESTVRHAVDMGYEVTVAADACASAQMVEHEASLRSMGLIAQIARGEAVFS